MSSFFLKRWWICSVLLSAGLYAAPEKLKKSDVRGMFEEMLTLHVEYKEFSPALAKRAVRLFIEQFDPYRSYLLASEVQPFLDMEDHQLDIVVEAFYRDDFSVFESLSKVFQKSILRSRDTRAQVVRELVSNRQDVDTMKLGNDGSYATSSSELKERCKKQLLNMLAAEKKLGYTGEWSSAKKQKLFQLWEKKFLRVENPYLVSGVKHKDLDHNLALHLMKSHSKSLDAHTSFFSPDEASEMRTSLEKQFEGVGIVLREGVDGIFIINIVKGGPAERSGKITPGDLLVEIDGKAIGSSAYEDALKRLKGERGSKVILGVRHKGSGGQSIDRVELLREQIVMQDERVQYSFEPYRKGVIGKIVLPSFYESGGNSSCEKDMKEAIRNLKKEGDLLGIVIDMRDNSGGFLNQAVKLSGLFMSSGVVVISKYAKGEIQYLRDVDGRSYYQGPLVLLTSKASASAAEIVAQALQDYGVAVVVGDERTYGKGTIQYQTVTDQQARNFFKVTVGRYYTVSGRSTQIEGVKADIVVPTDYAPYNIGERYLAYPLKNDQVAPAYIDPLYDVDPKNKLWFQKNYLPNVQKKLSTWTKMMPKLKENSAARLSKNKSFSLFLSKINGNASQDSLVTAGVVEEEGVVGDLQLEEAVNIVKDMIMLR